MTPSSRQSSPKVIRASEIGRWVYCERAWWMAEQGYENRNRAALQYGLDAHEQHAQQVAGAHRTRTYALVFMALGVLLLLAAFLFASPFS